MTTTISRFRTLAIAAPLVAITAIVGTRVHASQANKPTQPVAVAIDNFKFGTAALEIAAGTTVTWTNKDDVPHTVASATKVFKSAPLDTDEAFSYTFKEAGTFDYYCTLHPRMVGKVIVK